MLVSNTGWKQTRKSESPADSRSAIVLSTDALSSARGSHIDGGSERLSPASCASASDLVAFDAPFRGAALQ